MTQNTDHRLMRREMLFPFLSVTLIWGLTWIVIRDQLGVVPVNWSVTYRFIVAGVTLFIVLAVQRKSMYLPLRGHVAAMLLGAFQFVLNFNFVYRAEAYVASGLVALCYALLVVPNMVFGRIFYGVKVTRQFLLGASVSVAGLALLFYDGFQLEVRGDQNLALGIALTCGGVLSASLANVLQVDPRVRNLDLMPFLAWSMVWGTAANFVIAWVVAGPPVMDWRPGYIGGLLYLGCLASAYAFMAYFKLVRLVGPGKAAYSGVLVPILAMGISTLVEGYHWTLTAASGCVLALAGLVVALRARSPAAKSE